MIRRVLLCTALLTAAAGRAAASECVPFADGWKDFGACTRVDAAGRRWVKPEHLRALAFDKDGVAAVWIEGAKAFHYVGRDGRMVPVVSFDNAPDAFVEGRARTPAGGQIGYVDRTLRLAIPPRYDWGFP